MTTYDLVIVGAGHAGAHLVNTLHRNKFQGTIALISDENTPPYHRPPLSKECLTADTLKTRPLLSGGVHQNEQIALILNTRVTGGSPAEKTLVLSTGEQIGYGQLVLATGGKPRTLNVPGADLRPIFCLKTLEDAQTLRDQLEHMQHVVLIGGGFINLELAFSLASPTRHITILERMDRILQRAVSADISAYLAAQAEQAGIRILCNEHVEQIMGKDGHITGVMTASDQHMPADSVIVAIGSDPDTHLARQLGLTQDHTLHVDEHLRVAPDIFAMGDCVFFPDKAAAIARRLESVQNATDQADHIARQVLGETLDEYHAVPWFWSVQGDTRLHMAGLWHPDLVGIRSQSTETGFSIYHFDNNQLIAVESINSPGEHMLARKMLAARYSPHPEHIRAGFASIKAGFDQANPSGAAAPH